MNRRSLLKLGLGAGGVMLLKPRLLFAGESAVAQSPFTARADRIMGTVVEVYIRHPDKRFAAQVAEKALQACREVDRDLSHFRETSDLGRLAAASGGWVPVSEHFRAIFPVSQRVHMVSNGVFDPTAGALVKLWKDSARRDEEPSAASVNGAAIGYERIEFDTANRRARFLDPKLRLDFGAIGKGYAADIAGGVLRSNGIESGLVAASGDIRVIGRMPVKEIGIQHPGKPDADAAWIALDDGAVSTSGDYEQGLDFSGGRKSHHIDPSTREPAAIPPQSVTIIAPRGELSDSLATSVFLLGADRGLELVRSMSGCDALVIDSRLPKGYAATSGFEKRLRGSVTL